ncbi:MAG: hypothetical protein JSV34_00825 [Candidatus Omnitrophota bacterium]|nr:MAG: hypothetical protein JSV34_00825 [Candidatus Omnitrophota bacterium]
MSQIKWEKKAQEKFKEAVSKMPLFHRRIAEKLVKESAEAIVREKNRQEVTEEDVVRAFFKEVPPAFKGMMVRLLADAGIEYKKYISE